MLFDGLTRGCRSFRNFKICTFLQEKWVDKSNWIDREERDWGETKGVDMWGDEADKQLNIMEKERMMWTEQRPKYRKN